MGPHVPVEGSSEEKLFRKNSERVLSEFNGPYVTEVGPLEEELFRKKL